MNYEAFQESQGLKKKKKNKKKKRKWTHWYKSATPAQTIQDEILSENNGLNFEKVSGQREK